MRKTFSIRIDKKDYEKLKKIAEKEDRSVASLIRTIVKEYLASKPYSERIGGGVKGRHLKIVPIKKLKIKKGEGKKE